ncbi:uncharacterized protein DNG_04970 [Cephalotrichum gorgonifer]|uniref:Uncharacterized protein n=1 Tax=Cephalotrichum gorgonifer TaxID=2041049 RepID=A0AAE8SVV4_9PEZI|nr:uncharacterized protein DNG_04970 [Cephalotrichum gorgonifer]
MATITEIPAFTLEFEDPLPITLKYPFEDPANSSAASRLSLSSDHSEPSEPDTDFLPPPDRAAPEPPTTHVHPIPMMQEAFNESLAEATGGSTPDKPKLREYNATARRERLIAQNKADEVLGMRWRYRPGQQQHELCKLIAQIAFGMYLLLGGMANSDDQVVTIIQGHIDEIDEFLEVALEDFQQAIADLSERITYLRLPLEHIDVFEKLLEDRSYRAELLRNNETIEHILARTKVMLEQYENDMTDGLRSTKAFSDYLADERESEGLVKRPDVADIYDAMRGNTNGWQNAFMDLDGQVQRLSSLIEELSGMVAEMQSKAGEVSRRTWNKIEPFSVPGVRTGDRASLSSSNSARGSMSTAKSPSQRRLTIRTQLSPPPQEENPFDDDPSEAAKLGDGDSGRGSQDDAVACPDDESVQAPESLYILQPVTYTPKLPTPVPSPMVKGHPPQSPPPESLRISSPGASDPSISSPGIPKRSSLRQRVSQSGNKPPSSILIPPPNVLNPPSTAGYRVSPKVQQYPPDSAYGSDVDHQRNRSGSATAEGSSPSFLKHGRAIPSPRSDFQTYHPVQASPYSPLQQRPHTSHNTVRPPTTPTSMTPSTTTTATVGVGAIGYQPRHVRNQPSRLGGASTLSKVTYASATPSTRTDGGDDGKRLKKKRSAFGWLKKAFSLDEEERAAFDAKRAVAEKNLYYEDRSRKFLDGRRVRGDH